MAVRYDHNHKYSKTYKTMANADRAMGAYDDSVRYLVVLREDGRYMPIVTYGGNYPATAFCHHGVTMVGVSNMEASPNRG